MAIEKTIGKRIHALRKSLKMTQEELASLAELDRSYISEIENGRINFSVTTLHKISKALKTTLVALVSESDDEES